MNSGWNGVGAGSRMAPVRGGSSLEQALGVGYALNASARNQALNLDARRGQQPLAFADVLTCLAERGNRVSQAHVSSLQVANDRFRGDEVILEFQRGRHSVILPAR